MSKTRYVELVSARLNEVKDAMRSQFYEANKIASFVVDDFLPSACAEEIYRAFPVTSLLVLKKSLKEDKYIGVQMDKYNPICKEITYAFQDQRVLDIIAYITGIDGMYADPHLYASGLSLMKEGQFLNPHLDNSHDKDRKGYRVLNLLYYVTPDWHPDVCGGNLELWDDGLRAAPRVINYKFNRLVCMATHRESWHSVQAVTAEHNRCCVSNYYFSPTPIGTSEAYFHVTSFRGRPTQPIRDIVVRADAALRQVVRKILPPDFIKNPHVYKKDEAI